MSPPKVTVDYYAILGVARDATIKDINAAYKRLALKLHPDKTGGDAASIERFQKIQDAVEVLRDPIRRIVLDNSLKTKTKRTRTEPDDNWSTCGNEDDSERSSKRERHDPFSEPPKPKFGWGGYNPYHQKRGYNDAFFGKSDQKSKRPRHQYPPAPYSYEYEYSYSRYMSSFADSVHMNPDSEESKAKKAQFKADNVKWAEEWSGIDPNVEAARSDARERLRKEKVQAEAAREYLKNRKDIVDMYNINMASNFFHAQKKVPFVYTQWPHPTDHPKDTSKPGSPGDSNQKPNGSNGDQSPSVPKYHSTNMFKTPNAPNGGQPQFATKYHPVEIPEPVNVMNDTPSPPKLEDNLQARVESPQFSPTGETGNTSDTLNKSAYERTVQPYNSKSKINKDEPMNFEGISTPEPLCSDTSSNKSPASSHSASSHTSSNFCPGTPSSGSFTPKYDLDIQSAADKMIQAHMEAHMVGHESILKPLIPVFKKKLADLLGRYTINDLASELNGIILETYSGWLENIRSSMHGATPITTRNKPEACSHLGSWKKDYCRPQCDTCSFWMPLFTLTCPGCGLKACIRCKFTGDAFVIDRH